MADKIIRLKDKDGNIVYPLSRGVAADSIGTAALQDDSVTTSKIADSSITTSKIADGSVTSDKIDSTTLYEYTGSGHGEQGSITLSAPFTNFKYVEVFAENLDGGQTSTKVLGDCTIGYLSIIDYYNSAIYLKTAQFRVSGTSFTWLHNNYQMKITSAGVISLDANAKMGILKIIGYK